MQLQSCVACSLAASLCAVATQVSATEFEKIRAAKEIVVAHRDASLPFSYVVNGTPVGYSIDLCMKVIEAIKKELKLSTLSIRWTPVTSATRIPAIVQGKASLECGSTTNNAERRKLVDYTIAHFISASRFLVRSGSGIESIQDLAAKRVVSTRGTTNLRIVHRLNEEHGLKMQVLEAHDHAEAFEMVASGKADAFAMDDVLLYGLRASSESPTRFAVVGRPMTIEPYAIMLPKGQPELKEVVDREVRRVIVSGEINSLYKKWFESPIPPKGVSLDVTMPYMLRESFKYPSDKVGDLN
jgi:ABC-type amino acid transport substrate-binding protein